MMETAGRVCATAAFFLLAGNVLVVGCAALAEFAPATIVARVRPVFRTLAHVGWHSQVASKVTMLFRQHDERCL